MRVFFYYLILFALATLSMQMASYCAAMPIESNSTKSGKNSEGSWAAAMRFNNPLNKSRLMSSLYICSAMQYVHTYILCIHVSRRKFENHVHTKLDMYLVSGLSNQGVTTLKCVPTLTDMLDFNFGNGF